jgi:hypothetical protein
VGPCRWIPTFRREISPPSLGLTSIIFVTNVPYWTVFSGPSIQFISKTHFCNIHFSMILQSLLLLDFPSKILHAVYFPLSCYMFTHCSMIMVSLNVYNYPNQLVSRSPTFYGTRRSITVFTKTHHLILY